MFGWVCVLPPQSRGAGGQWSRPAVCCQQSCVVVRVHFFANSLPRTPVNSCQVVLGSWKASLQPNGQSFYRCVPLHCSRKSILLLPAEPSRLSSALTSCCLTLLGNTHVLSPSLQGRSASLFNWIVLGWIGFPGGWRLRFFFSMKRFVFPFEMAPETKAAQHIHTSKCPFCFPLSLNGNTVVIYSVATLWNPAFAFLNTF